MKEFSHNIMSALELDCLSEDEIMEKLTTFMTLMLSLACIV